ncbi:MAG: 5'/3'-nucleotidase SurE, partial [Thiopseudomonas sp.]
VNPRGKTGYWLAAVGLEVDGEEGTDFHAIKQGYVTVTPLQLDRTFHARLDDVQQWVEGLL